MFSPFSEILDDFRSGKMVIITDDSARENEGDLVVATAAVTPDHVNFMVHQARGLICVSIDSACAQKLNLPLQVLNNQSPYSTPFTVSVDHRGVIPNGVTASSRALTMRSMLEASAKAEDFVCPGHVFPLIAHPAGVLGRQGQTEGSADLARLAGFPSSGVLCEILQPNGQMARGESLHKFALTHGLKITSVQEIMRYRILNEVLVREVTRADLVTDFGACKVVVFEDDVDRKEHLALLFGEESDLANQSQLTRIHSECLTGDVFGSRRCDCGGQLKQAVEKITVEGRGVVLYLRQEGRGIGLANKLRAYELQDQGADTVEANLRLGFEPDKRDFAVAAKILHTLGIKKIRLMTNNPHKLQALKEFGIEITERIPLTVKADTYSENYLLTKREKLGHLL